MFLVGKLISTETVLEDYAFQIKFSELVLTKRWITNATFKKDHITVDIVGTIHER